MSWPMVSLESISIYIRNGASIKQNKDAAGLPITRIETIAERTVNLDKCGYANVKSDEYRNYRLADGDILISHINSEKHLAKCAIFEHQRDDVVHGMNLLCLRPDAAKVFPRYLFHYLSSPLFKSLIPSITKKSVNQASFTVTAFKDLKTPLPPLAEQKRIAAILDKADAIRRKRQQAIQLADDFLRAVFLDMFGDVSKFASLEIKEVASKKKHSLSSGPFGSSLTSKHYIEDGVIVLRGTNVTSGKMDLKDVKYISEDKAEELKRSALYPGDVVIVAVGASGRALRIPEGMPPAVMSQNFNKITPNTDIVTSTYLEYCFNSALVQRQFAQNTTDTVRTFLSLTKIKEVKIPVPPIYLQHKFEKIISETVCQIEKVNDSSLVTDTLFNSLSQKAFSGEL